MTKNKTDYRENLKRFIVTHNITPRMFIVYTCVNSVSRSGMSRRITAFIVHDNIPIVIVRNYLVRGCGMDMCFDFAYDLFQYLYNNNNYNSKVKYQNYTFHHSI